LSTFIVSLPAEVNRPVSHPETQIHWNNFIRAFMLGLYPVSFRQDPRISFPVFYGEVKRL